MEYYLMNTDAESLRFSPHDIWIEQGYAFTGGQVYYGELLGRLEPNDVCFMYVNKSGVMAVGKVLEKWDGKVYAPPVIYPDGTNEYRIKVDWFLDRRGKPIGISDVRDIIGIIPPQTLQRVSEISGEALLDRCLADIEFSLPDEIYDTDVFYEGAVRRVPVNSYERDRKARQKCIAYNGTRCIICEHTLDELYGEVGKGLIQVHHLRELSDIGEEYKVDPIKDLTPVCPNCHAIIHSRRPAYSIEEVNGFLRRTTQ
jgi:hypothetical protein